MSHLFKLILSDIGSHSFKFHIKKNSRDGLIFFINILYHITSSQGKDNRMGLFCQAGHCSKKVRRVNNYLEELKCL